MVIRHSIAWSPTPDVLRETLDGGQAFRWYPTSGDTWRGQWSAHAIELHPAPSPSPASPARASIELRYSSLIDGASPSTPDLARYFAADRDWDALADALPWRSDPHLARCLAAFPGLRILRQPFGETLLGFLCSATKQIVQIKQMLALLATRHGAPLAHPRPPPKSPPGRTIGHWSLDIGHSPARLPTWAELAAIPEADLRACQLGFRARYIKATADFLAANPTWLADTEAAPYVVAKARLCSLPGVGEKVADCVLLFGAGRLEAFPVDTWIIKAMTRHYGLDGWTPAQVAHFGRQHFGPAAGYAQQFLFAWERAHGAR